MLHNQEEEMFVKEIIDVCDQLLKLGLKIDEVIGRLCEKRVTLEEKMIRTYFHKVTINNLTLATSFHQLLASFYSVGIKARNEKKSEEIVNLGKGVQELLPDTREYLTKLDGTLEELLKVLRYDLNYLEQYFEHGYYSKLANDEQFLEKSQDCLRFLEKHMAAKLA